MAVDYLRCEAIKRAYDRLVHQRVDFIIENLEPAKYAKLKDICRKFYIPPLKYGQNVEQYLAGEEEKSRILDIRLACLSDPGNIEIARKAAYMKMHPMNREKIAKVAADLVAAKCP